LFTGWTDVRLTPTGEKESLRAGRKLKAAGFIFDAAFISYLTRVTETFQLALRGMKLKKLSARRDWRLNERHYGNLQGLNKAAMVKKFGARQVFIWRRSYSVRPPEIEATSRYNQAADKRYKGVKVPTGESLKDVVQRVIPFWRKEILPRLKKGDRLLVVASGNSLRALIKYLDKVPDDKIMKVDIPLAIPLVYEFDDRLRPIRHYYLADRKELAAAIKRVREMGVIRVK